MNGHATALNCMRIKADALVESRTSLSQAGSKGGLVLIRNATLTFASNACSIACIRISRRNNSERKAFGGLKLNDYLKKEE